MAQNPVFEKAATQAFQADHPHQLREQIDDAFYEAAEMMDQLRGTLTQLAEHLEGRFAAEEQERWFDEVLCRAPWLTPQAQELQQQHVPLVETVRGMQRMCDAENSPVAWWQRLTREFQEFSEQLKEHEEAHKHLLQEMHSGAEWPAEDE